jgi:thiamine transporter ThiT
MKGCEFNMDKMAKILAEIAITIAVKVIISMIKNK